MLQLEVLCIEDERDLGVGGKSAVIVPGVHCGDGVVTLRMIYNMCRYNAIENWDRESEFCTGVDVPVDGRPGQGVQDRAVDGERLPDFHIIMGWLQEEVGSLG